MRKRNLETLRGKVYGYLKEQINEQKLRAGAFLDLNRIGGSLE